MDPVGGCADLRVIDFEKTEPGQQETGDKQHNGGDVECEPGANGVAVGAPPGAAQVQGAEQQGGQDQQQSQAEMGQEHEQVEIVLVDLTAELPGKADSHQVEGVDDQQSEQYQNQAEQAAQ